MLIRKEIQLYLFLLVMFATVNAQTDNKDIDYDNLETEERPMPEELLSEIKNKTDYELEMEDCMIEFGSCITTQMNRSKEPEVCAESFHTTAKKTFANLCNMIYETCKGYGDWHFLHDGSCPDTPEFTDIPTATTESIYSYINEAEE